MRNPFKRRHLESQVNYWKQEAKRLETALSDRDDLYHEVREEAERLRFITGLLKGKRVEPKPIEERSGGSHTYDPYVARIKVLSMITNDRCQPIERLVISKPYEEITRV